MSRKKTETSVLSSAISKEVQDMYHKREPKLMSHNLEKKRIWKSRDFLECQMEGSV